MVVVDASAVLEALAAQRPAAGLMARLSEQEVLHAPHLIDVELLHGLRRMLQRGQAVAATVPEVRRDLADLAIVRHAHLPHADRVWELRDNLTAYDATYVALAEALRLPLVTCDAGIAGAPGHQATIELFSSGA